MGLSLYECGKVLLVIVGAKDQMGKHLLQQAHLKRMMRPAVMVGAGVMVVVIAIAVAVDFVLKNNSHTPLTIVMVMGHKGMHQDDRAC